MNTSPPISEEITQSSFAAMGGVLFSRASGLIRTIVVNASFGVGTALDAFNAAFRLPNSLRDLFADGALSAAFMSALVEEKQKGTPAERKLVAIVMGFFGITTLVLSLLGVYFARDIMDLITNVNFKITGGIPIATHLFQLLVFYLPITMINAVIMAILGVHGHSFRAMNGSLFLSVGMIIGALVLAPAGHYIGWPEVNGLALGALLGALLQTFYQMRPLFALNLIPKPIMDPRQWLNYPPLKKILAQMAPRAIGQGALVLALFINTYFATQIGTGFLTYIVTAVTIIQVPIGLFGVATGFVALPALVLTLQQNNPSQFSRLLVEGLRTALWLAAFTTIAFALFILPFYLVLFQHGKITWFDTVNNSIAICIYATGIILASGNKVLINTLYALDATRQLIYNAVIYLILNTVLNIFLVPKYGILGIGFSFGFATSVDFWINYLTIKHYFHRKNYRESPYFSGGKHFTPKILLLNIMSFAVCFFGIWLIKHFWVYTSLTFMKALLILIIGGALLTGIFMLTMLKLGPAHLKNSLIKLVRR